MPPPHIVFALCDDLGFNGVGYHNAQVATPQIDHLAANGVRLESFYTAPVCGPSRAALMTGRMPHKLQAGIGNLGTFWKEEGIDLSYTLLPQMLRNLGYATALIGKWHGGHARRAYLPTMRGFDTFYGFLAGCEDHVTQRNCCSECNKKRWPGVQQPVDLHRDGDPALFENGTSTYSHNVLRWAAAAVKQVHAHAARQRMKRLHQQQLQDQEQQQGLSPSSLSRIMQPLFLYIALQDPHAPYQVPSRFEEPFRHVFQPLRRIWYGMVSAIDETISNLTVALRNEGMWPRTLFWFASDNGSPVTGWGAGGSNHPLRGGKGEYWEGGVPTLGLESMQSPPFPNVLFALTLLLTSAETSACLLDVL